MAQFLFSLYLVGCFTTGLRLHPIQRDVTVFTGDTPREPSRLTPHGRRLAVLVCGLQTRLTLESKLTHVIEPAVAQGFEVFVYMELVKTGFESGAWFYPPSGQSNNSYANVSDLKHLLDETLSAAGARVEVLDLKEGNDDDTINASVREGNRTGLAMRRFNGTHGYPPAVSPFGRNVMRRLLSLQRLWQSARKHDPSFVLVTRDDDFWLGPLNLSLFLNSTDAQETVFSKGCRNWCGMNDKTLLLGGAAADRALSKIFDNFWDPDESLNKKNAERFWLAYVGLHNITSTPVPFQLLPTADVAFQAVNGSSVECLRGLYLCAFDASTLSGPIPPVCLGEESMLPVPDADPAKCSSENETSA